MLEISETGSVSGQLAEPYTLWLGLLKQLQCDNTESNYAVLMQPHSKSTIL